MIPLRTHPHLYEISTWPWLERLSAHLGQSVDLATVPDEEWDRLAAQGMDIAYLMGVWRRSAAGRLVARTDPALLDSYERALPGWAMRDLPGSPYSIQAYEPDQRVGGWRGVDVAREALARRGIRLLLDFVPNHTGFDHQWIRERPDLYVQGTVDAFRRHPDHFQPVDAGDHVTFIACGRDPYLAPWRDVAQLNYFNPDSRAATIEELRRIAPHCDGVRCDMTMLVLNDVFEQTWASEVELLWPKPAREFWPDAIAAAPELLFVAEVYWEREFQLQQLGFHYTYDKRLLDRLRDGNGTSVRSHLAADPAFSAKLVRFLENHDEDRAASVFDRRLPAAAATAFTIPGLRFFFDGQLQGERTHYPVQLGRWLDESPDAGAVEFHQRLLEFIDRPLLHDGHWQMRDVSGTDGSADGLIAWSWERGEERALVVANVSSRDGSGRVRLPALSGASAWSFRDHASGVTYRRTADELSNGLTVILAAGAAHLFVVTAA